MLLRTEDSDLAISSISEVLNKHQLGQRKRKSKIVLPATYQDMSVVSPENEKAFYQIEKLKLLHFFSI